jgi:hypothetical protein
MLFMRTVQWQCVYLATKEIFLPKKIHNAMDDLVFDTCAQVIVVCVWE